MIEKVNPKHPDKVADRVAGAIVDLCYTMQDNPKVAVEVLVGHNVCHIIAETSVELDVSQIKPLVERIVGECELDFVCVPQDQHLAQNQDGNIKCGDNGIFKGVPLTQEEKDMSTIAKQIYNAISYDGKYILDKDKLIICQSNTDGKMLKEWFPTAIINPIGEWTGGINVDTGATNRKLGSDMATSVTGGGLHGKDLSKADVSVNIYAFLKAQKTNKVVQLSCAIGDDTIDGKPYREIVDIARQYIKSVGGFEKFAEWGLY